MTTQQTHSLVGLAIEQLNISRQLLLALIEPLSDKQLTVRVGNVGNHAIWVMGHVAFAEDLFVSSFLGEPSKLPEGHVEQFCPGTIPSDCASDYPNRDELIDRLATARKRTLEWVKMLEGDAAWEPTPEPLPKFVPNAITAACSLSQHEFLHAGQITTIRASLGMKPIFG